MRYRYPIILLLSFCILPGIHAQEFKLTQKIFASDREVRESFGQHVQIYDDFAFASAPKEGAKLEIGGTTSGAVYVFKRDSSGFWKEVQKLLGSGNDKVDNFGYGIERSGNTLIIGAHSHTRAGVEYAGAAYVFNLDESGNWIETQKLVASDKSERAHFGIDVAISGDNIIVGAYGQQLDLKGKNPIPEGGAAYLFKRDESGQWIEQKKIVSPFREMKGRFGHTVYISGNYAAVGAVFERNAACGFPDVEKAGVLYMYHMDEQGEWNFVQRLTHSDRLPHDSFACEIIIQNEEMFVTSYYKEVQGQKTAGAVYFFQRGDNGLWCERQKIISPEPLEKDYFGHSVAIHEDLLLVGSGWWQDVGAGYLYKKNACGYWTYVQKINATGTDTKLDAKDNFGGYVSISKEYVIIGADDDHHAPGGEDLYDAGSAFIFSIKGFDTLKIPCESSETDQFSECEPCDGKADPSDGSIDENSEENSNEEETGKTNGSARFKVSPNPNNGQFTIEIIGARQGPYPVKIKKPFSGTILKLSLSEKITSVDLGRDAQGLYILKISTKEGVKSIPVYVEQEGGDSRN